MLEILRLRTYLFRKIRDFFEKRGYLEVETPHIVRTVLPDPYVDPIRVCLRDKEHYFLHTSPEIHMKKLLAKGLKRIFQICRVFRAEKEDPLHRIEFTMLEWYREGNYLDTLKETESLVNYLSSSLEVDFGIKNSFRSPFFVFDLEDLFLKTFGINPFHLDTNNFYDALRKKGLLTLKEDDTWADIFFKAFFEKIEPQIDKSNPYFLYGWPSCLSSTAKEKNGKAERFELYIYGIEIANGYSELLSSDEQRKRLEKDNIERRRMNKMEMIVDEEFISSLSQIKGDFSGVALGVDRLLMVLIGERDIGKVLPFSV